MSTDRLGEVEIVRETTAANSTTRQKSCNNCVKSKRGCDKRYPVCSRCEERNMTCIYAKPPLAEERPGFFDFELMDLDPRLSNSANAPAAFLNNHLRTSPTASAAVPTTLTPDPVESLLSMVESGASSAQDMWMVSCNSRDVAANDDEPALNTANYAIMDDICPHYEPWQVYDPNSKVYFVVQVYKSLHKTFSSDGETPFLHRYLYRDNVPGLVLSCFTTSSLYANQTPKNKHLVFRALQRDCHDLKQQNFANTPQEKLARAQVLFIHLSIQLFDGDVTLRANADRDMPLLQSWLDELSRIRGNLGALARMNDVEIQSAPPQSWEGWLFAESVRRTIVLGNSFIALWKLMHGGDHSVGAWAYVHRWTLSRALWEAPSSFDFFSTWRGSPQYIISNYDFDSFLKRGSGSDVDDFTRILLVTYMGLDETKQWFMDTGTEF